VASTSTGAECLEPRSSDLGTANGGDAWWSAHVRLIPLATCDAPRSAALVNFTRLRFTSYWKRFQAELSRDLDLILLHVPGKSQESLPRLRIQRVVVTWPILEPLPAGPWCTYPPWRRIAGWAPYLA